MAVEEPLSPPSRPSVDQPDSDVPEDARLLTGDSQKPTPHKSTLRWRSWREFGLFVWAVLASAALLVGAVTYEQAQSHADQSSPPNITTPLGKRNLVFMVSDGMGPTSLTLARSFKQHRQGLNWTEGLDIDRYLTGHVKTRSSSSLITDSAASGSAYACARKTYNGAISVDQDGMPLGSVLEAAKAAGYMTGLVVTTRITDATPAVFASHAHLRSSEDIIAEQIIGDGPLGHLVDVIFGGGLCHFLPQSLDTSCREDDKDVLTRATSLGYHYVHDRVSFDKLTYEQKYDLPLLGLFADYDIPYDLDLKRSLDKYPSLKEMALAALTALSKATKDSDKGFFLMVEGSRIDHAGHSQDPAAQVNEVLAYDEAFSAVVDYIQTDETPGLVLSTSDHETGGLSAGRQLHTDVYPVYQWFPSVLSRVIRSAEYMAADYDYYLENDPNRDVKAYLTTKLKHCYGVDDASDKELDNLIKNPDGSLYTFADLISRRAQVGWSTHGHSGADVNLYTSNSSLSAELSGTVDNTEVGQFLQHFLDVDASTITDKLHRYTQEQGNSQWMGAEPSESHVFADHDHYEGDFKMRRKRTPGRMNRIKIDHWADWASSGEC